MSSRVKAQGETEGTLPEESRVRQTTKHLQKDIYSQNLWTRRKPVRLTRPSCGEGGDVGKNSPDVFRKHRCPTILLAARPFLRIISIPRAKLNPLPLHSVLKIAQ